MLDTILVSLTLLSPAARLGAPEAGFHRSSEGRGSATKWLITKGYGEDLLNGSEEQRLARTGGPHRSNAMEPSTSDQIEAILMQPESSPSTESQSALPPSLPEKPRALIESSESGVKLDLVELWSYRELLYFLTWRDVKVRYKQTFMGAAWVILQPLFTMILFTIFFNKFVGVKSGNTPYPLFAYSGLLLWTFFSNAVVNSAASLISNTNLITKVYFPRMFIPAAAVAAGLVDLAIASVILLGLGLYYGIGVSLRIAFLPIFIILAALLALGVGLLASALTVKYRDLRHALPFIIQFWLFASPVIYPSSIVPEKWRWVLFVNPFTGIVEGFRSSVTGSDFGWFSIAISASVTLAVLAVSVYVFRRTEDTFADLI